MKTLMSLAIAAALTLSVMPAMVDVSAEAQEPDAQQFAQYIGQLLHSEIARLLAEDNQSTGGQLIQLRIADMDIDVSDISINVFCVDGDFCSYLADILEDFGFFCRRTDLYVDCNYVLG